MTKANLKNILTAVRDIINRSSETAIRKAQSAEKQAGAAQATAKTAKTAAENAQTTADSALTTADNAQTTADNAQTTADNAQTTADNAQTTADNAQTTADKNKEVLAGAFSSVATFTFDKQTSGRDTFKFNDFNYYKISDFNPSLENVTSFKGTKENGVESSEINAGSNCVKYGFFIVVASAGACSLPIITTVGSFTAPSAGLYAKYEVDNPYQTAGTGEFTLMSYGLTIKSSTYGSTKKFKITVDDSGTLSATEVTA